MSEKKLLYTGLAAYCVMLILAAVFYKERCAFSDMAFHLFCLLKDGQFAIQNYRFGAFFTQLFPLAGRALHLPLREICILYSCSFIVLYGLTFLLILKAIKEPGIALCYLLFSTLMVRHTFYWIQSELPQAAAFAFVYFALLYRQLHSAWKVSWGGYFLMFCLLLVAVFSHPLMIFLFVFFYLLMATRFYAQRRVLVGHGIVCVLVYLVKSIVFQTPYDSGSMGKLLETTLSPEKWLHLESNRAFIRYFIRDYFVVALMWLALAMFYIRSRQLATLLLVTGYFMAYGIVVNFSEPGGAHQYYLENRYLLLSAVVGIPFALDWPPALRHNRRQLKVVLVLVLVSIAGMLRIKPIYAKRVLWCEQFLANTESRAESKLVLSEKDLPMDILMVGWGISYEMWLLSTLKGASRCLIAENSDNEFENALGKKRFFQAKWGLFDYREFNGRYFRFADTSTAYVRYEP